MANSEAEAAWKFCVVDFEVNGVQLVGTVSENWMTSCDDEVWYPPSSIKGRKLSKYITEHQTPEEDWIKYECSLLKICGKPHYFFFPCYLKEPPRKKRKITSSKQVSVDYETAIAKRKERKTRQDPSVSRPVHIS